MIIKGLTTPEGSTEKRREFIRRMFGNIVDENLGRWLRKNSLNSQNIEGIQKLLISYGCILVSHG